MKKRYLGLTWALMLLSGGVIAQQKLSDGTDGSGISANANAILELASRNKGLLHTRIALIQTSSAAPMTAHVAGMMVYNTATANDVVPGIYYNDGSKWVLASGGQASNINYNPSTYEISFIDGNGQPVTIDFKQVVKANETETKLTVAADGRSFTYVNEKSVPVTVDLSAGPAGRDGEDGNTVIQGIVPPVADNGKDGDTYIDTATGNVYEKAGNTWIPRGNIKGPKGDKGDNGSTPVVDPVTGNWTIDGVDTGVPAEGKDGQSLLQGTTAPTAADGKDGDTYIDTATGNVYEKDNGAWTPTGNIKGADGADGKDGSVVAIDPVTGNWTVDGVDTGVPGEGKDGQSLLQGTTAPTAADGRDGDTYIDSVTGDIYEKDPVNGWEKTGNIKGIDGTDGVDGKSAYEIWKELPGNETGTEQDFIDSLKGANGTDGKDGSVVAIDPVTGNWFIDGVDTGVPAEGKDGQSLLQGTAAPTAADGKDGDTYIDSATGDIYEKDPVNGWEKTGNIKGIDGTNGVDGKSAYEIWKELPGNETGTEQDFIDSLKGADGMNGTNGTDGKDGSVVAIDPVTGNWFIDGVNTGVPAEGKDGQSLLQGTIAPTAADGKDGDTYIDTATGNVYEKDNGAWTPTGNIKGADGADGKDGSVVAIDPVTGNWTIDGVDTGVPAEGKDGQSLLQGTAAPTAADGKDGDTYIDSATGDIYEKDPVNGWEKTGNIKGIDGTNGVDGKSAYEIWKELPGNETGTEQDFIDSLKGADGTNGADGKDGSVVAIDPVTGNWTVDGVDTGVPAEGKDGQSLLQGTAAPTAADGKDGDTYIDTATGNVYEKDNGAWTPTGNIKGADGADGKDGSVVAIDPVTGNWTVDGVDTGVPAEGKDGQSLLQGTAAPTAAEGKDGDTYIDSATGDIYEKDPVNGWEKTGNIKGIDGTDGVDGKSAYEIWKELPGNETSTEQDFIDSLKGADGTNGTNGTDGKDGSVVAIDPVTGNWTVDGVDTGVPAEGKDGQSLLQGTAAPTAADGKDGDTYIDTATGNVYEKDNGAWTPTGNIKGADGADGKDGSVVAIDPVTGNWTVDGVDTGVPAEGKDGQSLLQGTAAPTAADGKDGDTYIDTATGNVYEKDNGAWTPTGNIKGADGADGKDGSVVAIDPVTGNWTVDGVDTGVPAEGKDGQSLLQGTAAPTAADGKDGDTYIDSATGDIYEKDPVNGWEKTGNIKGIDGTDGADGKSAYEIWKELPGNETGTEQDFIDSLKGADGADGKDGSVVAIDPVTGNWIIDGVDTGIPAEGKDGQSLLQGTAAPTAADGKDGDTYIDTATGDIYEKDPVNGWEKTGNIKGIDGTNGVDGKSAYEIWKELPGNETGTEQDFIDSLKGADGTNGANGTDGKDGSVVAIDPVTGNWTVDGVDTGVPAEGKDGQSLLQGTTAPTAADGKDGDTYIDTATGNVYEKDNGNWEPSGNIKGPKGNKGDDGVTELGNGTHTTVTGDGTPDDPYQVNVNAANLTATSGDNSITVTNGQGTTLINTQLHVTDGGITTAKLADKAVTAPKMNAQTAPADAVPTATGNNGEVQYKQVPRFFYMPAVIFDTSTPGTGLTRNLYQDYVNQFTGGISGPGSTTYNIAHGANGSSMPYTGGIVGSTGAPADIVTYGERDMYYYVTYYDTDVFENVSINEDGVLTYSIKAEATETSYMNIVFVIK